MKDPFKTIFVLLISGLLFLFFGCSKSSDAAYHEAPYGMQKAEASYRASGDASGASSSQAGFSEAGSGEVNFPAASPPLQTLPSRKLIKSANLRLRVEDPAATEKPLADLLEKYNAWPASSGIYENSRYYTIRVPSASYTAMLSELAGLGRLLGRSESAEDVTLRYYDLEGRLATKKELLKTYQGYLGKAKNIDEIMTVESRIADLQNEIDYTGTQLRNLASLVDYSTIEVEISGPAGVSDYSKPTLREKMGELFGSFGDIASSAAVVLTGIIIYGVPLILVLILLFWVLFGRIGLLRRLIQLAAGKKFKPRENFPDEPHS